MYLDRTIHSRIFVAPEWRTCCSEEKVQRQDKLEDTTRLCKKIKKRLHTTSGFSGGVMSAECWPVVASLQGERFGEKVNYNPTIILSSIPTSSRDPPFSSNFLLLNFNFPIFSALSTWATSYFSSAPHFKADIRSLSNISIHTYQCLIVFSKVPCYMLLYVASRKESFHENFYYFCRTLVSKERGLHDDWRMYRAWQQTTQLHEGLEH